MVSTSCTVKHFATKVKIDDVPLSTVASQKYLGITFDNKLDWSTHVAAICKTMSFYLLLLLFIIIINTLQFWINSHKKSLPTEVIKMLVDSLVLSCLIYAFTGLGSFIVSVKHSSLTTFA